MKDVHVSSETPAYLPVFLYENENLLYNFCQKHAEFLGKISACFLIYMGHRTKRILRIERKEYQTY